MGRLAEWPLVTLLGSSDTRVSLVHQGVYQGQRTMGCLSQESWGSRTRKIVTNRLIIMNKWHGSRQCKLVLIGLGAGKQNQSLGKEGQFDLGLVFPSFFYCHQLSDQTFATIIRIKVILTTLSSSTSDRMYPDISGKEQGAILHVSQ